jgi:hypothetical protein
MPDPADAPNKIRRYADISNPLFWNKEFNRVGRMFESACTMARVTGMKDTDWDSYTESIALLEDFTTLREVDLPRDRFPIPTKTHVRLALISYSHMIEMRVSDRQFSQRVGCRLSPRWPQSAWVFPTADIRGGPLERGPAGLQFSIKGWRAYCVPPN